MFNIKHTHKELKDSGSVIKPDILLYKTYRQRVKDSGSAIKPDILLLTTITQQVRWEPSKASVD